MFHHIKTASTELLHNITQATQFSTNLCKLLFVKNELNEISVSAATVLLSKITDTRNSLSETLNRFLKETNVKEEIKTARPKYNDLTRTLPEIKDEKITVENVGEKLGKLLMKEDLEIEKTGLIVDWLCSIELEVLNPNEGNIQVCFSNSSNQLFNS